MATNTFWSEFHTIVTGTWDNCWADLNIRSKKSHIGKILKDSFELFDSNIRKTYGFWSACIRLWIPTQFCTEFSMASNAFWPKFHTVFTCAWEHCWANLQRLLSGQLWQDRWLVTNLQLDIDSCSYPNPFFDRQLHESRCNPCLNVDNLSIFVAQFEGIRW